jgi:hypothetical protein
MFTLARSLLFFKEIKMSEKRFRYLCVKDNGPKGISIKFSRERKFSKIKKGNIIKLSESEAKMFPDYFELVDQDRKQEIKAHIESIIEKNNKVDEPKDITEEEEDCDIEEEEEESTLDTSVMVYEKHELEEMKSGDLRGVMRKHNLNDKGSKKVLIKRYLEFVNTALELDEDDE